MARRWRLVSVTPVGAPKSWMTDPRTGRQVPNPSAGLTEWASAVIETDLDIGRPMAAGAYRKLYIGDELPEGSITDLTTSGVTLVPPTEGPEFTVPIGSGEQIESRARQRARSEAGALASFPHDEYHKVDYNQVDWQEQQAAVFERWKEEQGLDQEEANRLFGKRNAQETEKARQATLSEEGRAAVERIASQHSLASPSSPYMEDVFSRVAGIEGLFAPLSPLDTGGAVSAATEKAFEELMLESDAGQEMREIMAEQELEIEEAQETGIFRPYELYDYGGLQ